MEQKKHRWFCNKPLSPVNEIPVSIENLNPMLTSLEVERKNNEVSFI